MTQYDNNSPTWIAKYQEYLGSGHWLGVRGLVLTRDRICQSCFDAPSSQCHHVSYFSFNKFGMSFAVECVGLCYNCHKKMHEGIA